MNEDDMNIDQTSETSSKSQTLQTLATGPLSSSLVSLSASARTLPSNKDFHFYYNFHEFKLPIQQIAAQSQSLLDSIGSSNRILKERLHFPSDLDFDESYNVLVDMNDEILERFDASIDEFHSIRKKEEETGRISGKETESGFQMVYAKKKKGLINSGSGPLSGSGSELVVDSGVKVADMKARVKAKVPFHIATIKKPQEVYNILVNNSNQPFGHVWLQRSEDGLRSIHPLEKLSVLDFVDKSNGDIEALSPSPLEHTPFKLVEEVKDLKELVSKLRGVNEFAVDLEHNQYRSFQGLTCLMQISTRTEDFVIDTLKLRIHVGPYLREVFKDPTKKKVMHGADRDIVWLQRDFGIYICNLFDTGQASRVLKMDRNSLEYLLQHFCGVTANKGYQNADWRLRPLPDEMLRYAREDTHYLLYIYDMMRGMLLSMPNDNESSDSPLLEVYKRSYDICMQLYEKELLTESSYLHIYGLQSSGFSAQQLAIVAGLFEWRDVVARAEDESTGYILPNKTLLEIAKQMPVTPPKLRRALKSKHPYVERNLGSIVNIIRHAMQNSDEFEAAALQLKEGRMETKASPDNVEVNDNCEVFDMPGDDGNATDGNRNILQTANPPLRKEVKDAREGLGGFFKSLGENGVESGSYISRSSRGNLPISQLNRDAITPSNIYSSSMVTGATVQAKKKPTSAFGALLGGPTSKRMFESNKKDKEAVKLESIRTSVKLPFHSFMGRNEQSKLVVQEAKSILQEPKPVVEEPHHISEISQSKESNTAPATCSSLEEIIVLSDDSDGEEVENDNSENKDTRSYCKPAGSALEMDEEPVSLSDLSTSFQKCFQSNNHNKTNEKSQEPTGLVQLKTFDYAAARKQVRCGEGAAKELEAAGDGDQRSLLGNASKKIGSGVGQVQKDDGVREFQQGKRRQAFPATGNRSATFR